MNRLNFLLELLNPLMINKWFFWMIPRRHWVVQHHWFSKHQSISHRSLWSFYINSLHHLLLLLTRISLAWRVNTRSIVYLQYLRRYFEFKLMMSGCILCALSWDSIIFCKRCLGFRNILLKWFSKIKFICHFLILVLIWNWSLFI